MKFIRTILLLGAAAVLTATPAFSQATGSLTGSVTDALGAILVGASITVESSAGVKKTAVTNARGEYSVTGLTPGKYTVKAIAPKFALYENTDVTVSAGEKTDLIVVLTVSGVEEQVEVATDNTISTDADSNSSATVIKGKDIDALPDDPDELAAALQALAGPSAGPNGGQIYIDGFTGGSLPSKDSIREIRINSNPFSAEYDRLGFGRIEILTKPGSDKFRGSAFGNFNDESLNSRNPFAVNRAPSQMRFFGANFSGPIQKKKSSYSFEINNRDVDNNAIVNAVILDPSLNITNFSREVRVPSRRFSLGPRIDYALNDKNTLVVRYSFDKNSAKNQGVSDTSLPSRAYISSGFGHELRVTETAILNAKTVNETRFEYSYDKRSQTGDSTIPTISVASAFTGGGSSVGNSFNRNKTWELNNFTSTSFGKGMAHSIKVGGRLRHVDIDDRSDSNYAGSFVFAGFAELRSPAGCTPVSATCVVVAPAVTSIDQYRQKLLGITNATYSNFNPTQFTLTTGNPLASVSQTEGSLFFTDDWRFSPALMLSFGLRYENQTNIKDGLNFAPRFGFAWSPGAGGAKAPKTVFRGGAGVFFDRFGINNTLTALRFNGINQLSLVVSANETDPVRRAAALTLLAQPVFNANGTVSNLPTAAQILAALPVSSTIRNVAPTLHTPYTTQIALGVERQLPFKTTFTAYYIGSKTLNVIRAVNINAPICPLQIACNNAPRPQPTQGNIFQYESNGRNIQNQLMLAVRTTINTKMSFSANYRLGFAKSDTDGGSPAYSYDFSGEYGRSGGDVRHYFTVFGNFTLPWNISFNPFVIASSGRPFNITKGVDLNGDSLFNERPTFSELNTRCVQLNLNAPYCAIGTNDPNAIIPRNYGEAPGFFVVNLRVGKNFGFGKSPERVADGNNRGGGNRGGAGGGGMPGGMMGGMPGGGGGGPRGGGGGGFGGFGGGEARKPYNLNVGINFSNLFNNVNFNAPVGSLSSNRFGQSTNISGGFGGFGGGGGGTANRRVELQMRFSW